LPADWETNAYAFAHRDLLIRSRDELGVRIARIDGWEQLVGFARQFARDTYETGAEPTRARAPA
jgi:hypothetical protein